MNNNNMNNLPEEIIEIIHDYTVGTKKHWKYNYRDCVIDMNMHLLVLDDDAPDIEEIDPEFFECNYKYYHYLIRENLKIEQYGTWGEDLWQRRWISAGWNNDETIN
jgi:hypothetical protein